MAEKKVTEMLIKVDLQCSRCYKKIKKILCEFPQIQDQKYNDKQNTVLITVVCCSPEKIRQKIICKGGETVTSVEIVPEKPKTPDPKPKTQPQPPPKAPEPPLGLLPVPVCPMVSLYPAVGVCCCPPCYGGYGRGPCYCGRRRPVMCGDGCGRRACECPGGNRGYYVSPCDYFSEENAVGCTVM